MINEVTLRNLSILNIIGCAASGCLLVAFCGCAKQPNLTVPEKAANFPIANTEEDCVAKSGEWVDGRSAVADFCIIKTRDEGKSCDNHDDCESFCEEVRSGPASTSSTGVDFHAKLTQGFQPKLTHPV